MVISQHEITAMISGIRFTRIMDISQHEITAMISGIRFTL